jgi:hypothetical protein
VLPLRPDLPAPERQRLVALARAAVVIVNREPRADQEISAARLLGDGVAPAPALPPVVANPAWLIASGGSTGAPKLIASAASTVVPAGARSSSRGRGRAGTASRTRCARTAAATSRVTKCPGPSSSSTISALPSQARSTAAPSPS